MSPSVDRFSPPCAFANNAITVPFLAFAGGAIVAFAPAPFVVVVFTPSFANAFSDLGASGAGAAFAAGYSSPRASCDGGADALIFGALANKFARLPFCLLAGAARANLFVGAPARSDGAVGLHAGRTPPSTPRALGVCPPAAPEASPVAGGADDRVESGATVANAAGTHDDDDAPALALSSRVAPCAFCDTPPARPPST